MSNGDSKVCDENGSKRLSTSGATLYEILELQKGATEEEIKRSYRKLALRYHPDKNRDDPKAADKFKEINKANGVLTDSKKRRIYDKYGSFGLNLVNQVGEDKAAFLLKFENPCVKAILILMCLFTGCCYCCFCYCLCCCKFCCGKYAPKENTDVDVEANMNNFEEVPS